MATGQQQQQTTVTGVSLLAAANQPTLSVNDVTLMEDSCQGKSFVFTVTLSRLTNKVITVHYATSDGSTNQTGTAAVANKDYAPVSGTLTFTHDAATEGPHGTDLMTITVPLGNYVARTATLFYYYPALVRSLPA